MLRVAPSERYFVSSTTGTADISTNTISNVNIVGGSSCGGIELSYSGTSATMNKNTVTKVRNRNTGGFGAFGLRVGSGNAVTITNNCIYDVLNIGTGSFTGTFNATGIACWRYKP
ncbi:MAG: hypothetical protein IPK25_19225 [Saprospiraceae bacterium]|nr:hypothetical protein [Saprospiraceae bacterium]